MEKKQKKNVSSDKDGRIDAIRKLQEYEKKKEGRYGSNGGQGCDALRGPCSCGAWH